MKVNATHPNIKIVDQDQAAKVATEFHVMHTPNEFFLTVIAVIPQMGFKISDQQDQTGKRIPQLLNTGIHHKVVGRFGMSPATFKKMVNVSGQNLKQYEGKYGEIAINPPEGLQ
jgi:hypothetical protein